MAPSLLKILGLGEDESPTLMVLHQDRIQIASLVRENESIKLNGYNETTLEPGIIEDGYIKDINAFGAVFSDLCKTALPKPISNKTLIVNAPYELIYPFVKDFPHHAPDNVLHDGLMEHIRKESPTPPEQLDLKYDRFEGDHILSLGAYGVPLKWKNRLLEAVSGMGIKEIDFIAEPNAELAVSPNKTFGNFALFSCHGSQIYVTLFHNNLIFDNYFLSTKIENNALDCNACLEEFENAKKYFNIQFRGDINTLYFIGFNPSVKKSLSSIFSSTKYGFDFLSADSAELFSAFEKKKDRATLIGMATLTFLMPNES